MIVTIEDVLFSFQIVRVPAYSRSTLSFHTLPPKFFSRAAEEFDALLE